MEKLLRLLHSIHPISDGLRHYLEEHLKTRHLLRKQFLLRSGEVCRDICFVKSGLLRCFYLRNDTEVCSWFMKDGDVIVSVPSFFNQATSYEFIQALEESTLQCISYTKLQFIYHHFPEFNFIARTLTEKYYTLSEERLFSIRMQKSDERFRHLCEAHPELVRRVPSKHLASYLGVREETFSRMRSKK